jgi:branched-chain amino acid transport system substrate-binding protein
MLHLFLHEKEWAMMKFRAASSVLAMAAAMFVTAAMAQGQDPIKIGVVGPNSGPYTIIGEEVRNGFDLYLSEIGGAAGGRQLELIYEDTQAKPDVGLTKVKKLVEKDGVSFVGGVVSSSVAYALRDYIVSQKIPLIVTVASADGLTQQGAAPNIFRSNSSGSQVSHPLGQWLYEKGGYRKLVMIAPNYAMGYEQTGGFARTFVEAGGKIVKTLYPPMGSPDFGPFLTSFDASSADAVGAVFAGSDAIKFVKQYSEYGLKGKLPLVSTILLTDDLILQQEGDAALGITSASHYSSALDSAANKKFVDAYRAKYNRDPTLYSEASYVGARVIADAVTTLKGNISNFDQLIAAMKKVTFEAPRGQFRFDEYNSPIHKVYIFNVEKVNGKLVNKPIAEFENVSQFWKWSPKDYMAMPNYSAAANSWVK